MEDTRQVHEEQVAAWNGRSGCAWVDAQEALALFQADGDQLYAAYALRRLGSIAINRGDLDRAAPLVTRSAALLRTFGVPWDTAFASYLSGRLAVAAGKNREAASHFTEAADAFRLIVACEQ